MRAREVDLTPALSRVRAREVDLTPALSRVRAREVDLTLDPSPKDGRGKGENGFVW